MCSSDVDRTTTSMNRAVGVGWKLVLTMKSDLSCEVRTAVGHHSLFVACSIPNSCTALLGGACI
jgi:hypothetical protein